MGYVQNILEFFQRSYSIYSVKAVGFSAPGLPCSDPKPGTPLDLHICGAVGQRETWMSLNQDINDGFCVS